MVMAFSRLRATSLGWWASEEMTRSMPASLASSRNVGWG